MLPLDMLDLRIDWLPKPPSQTHQGVALLQYLQRNDGLPDPNGSLLSAILAQTIAQANQEVQAVAEMEIQVRERGKTRHIQSL